MTEFSDAASTDATRDTREEDLRLFANLASKDPASLGALYDRFGRVVHSLAARMLSDRRKIEEVTQDVFLVVWEKGYDPDRSSPLTWLATITRNKCIDRLRKSGSRIPHATDEFEDHAPVIDEHPASDPFRMSALGDLSRQVHSCLVRLSESQRVVVRSAGPGILNHESALPLVGLLF